MQDLKKLIIFGTAEIAELAKFYVENDSERKVVGFTVDDEFIKENTFMGCPVIPYSELREKFASSEYDVHVALSYSKLNQLREQKYAQVKQDGYTLASYVCTKSVFWPNTRIGDNCFVLENQTLQPNVEIGNNVMIWSGNHIGHSSKIGDSTYISSHVVISGHCNIGKRNFFGVNSSVKDFCEIGDDCFITMGASITSNIESGSVVLKSKDIILSPDDRKAKALKRSYFGG